MLVIFDGEYSTRMQFFYFDAFNFSQSFNLKTSESETFIQEFTQITTDMYLFENLETM